MELFDHRTALYEQCARVVTLYCDWVLYLSKTLVTAHSQQPAAAVAVAQDS